MWKKLKKLSLSTVLILSILISFGGFTFARTVRKDIIEIMRSDKDLQISVKNAVMNFASDFEQLIPHERRMNTLLYYATGIFNSNHVIWGKDDWLFYSSRNSGDPIADYEGTNSYSAEDMERIKTNILNLQNSLNDQGLSFCLLIPPNKENLYAKYMPDRYIQAEKSRTEILMEYLCASGINCVNPKEALQNCDDQFRTYYKQDTHWNELGAYIGTAEVLRTFGIELPAISADKIEPDDTSIADLADMVGLSSVFPKDYGFRMAFTAENRESITKEEIGKMTHWHNNNAPVDSTLLLIGDSFREAMVPVLSAMFKDFYVVHSSNYQEEMIDTASPDYIVLEIVERLSEGAMNFGK